MSPFLHVEFNIPLYSAQSVLQNGENQETILFLYPKLWNFENSETSNLKSHNNEKMAVKEKELYFNIIKILEKSSKNLGHCFIEGLWFIEKYIQLRGYRPSTPEYCYKKYL